MAKNYFIGWQRAELESLRRVIQEALVSGKIVSHKSAGVETEYDPKDESLPTKLDWIQYAISQLPDADPSSPNDANPAHDRPGITSPVFV